MNSKVVLSLCLALICVFFNGHRAEAESAVPDNVGSCPHQEAKEISFLNRNSKDTLELYLLGEDCTKSVVVLLVRAEDDRPLFWDTWPLWNLAVYSLSEAGEFERTFKQLQDLKVTSATDIPALDSECFENEYCYLGPYTTPEGYTATRAENIPVLCIPVHYENTRCYVYDQKQHVTILLYGFGA